VSNPVRRSYILLPGAGGMAWYWHRVSELLEQAQREAIAVDLPGDDENTGLCDYADIVVREIGQKTNVILVAQSLGAFTAAIVCERVSVRMLVFVNAMIPSPGETAGDWWEHTGATRARIAVAESAGYGTEFDLQTYFLHDLPEATLKAGPAHQPEEAAIVFTQPCKFRRWPCVTSIARPYGDA
jgi:pimeloyl-ACP methyl ester carboxylesterase